MPENGADIRYVQDAGLNKESPILSSVPVHVITRKRLNDFAAKHPDSMEALER